MAALALSPCRAEVELAVLRPSARWPDATEPGALRRACSASTGELRALFDREGVPFRSDLVHHAGGKDCHLFYRPTVPGFRAAPDDDPIREILFDSDPLLYLATKRNHGETVGAMREVLRRIARPLEVGLLIHRVHDPGAYEKATRQSFGDTPHRISLLDRGVERNFWWVQDYLKSGAAPRGPSLLVPYRLFEGSPETGEAFEPLLARLSRQERAVRSRLSWEGGDLQFTRDPRDPRRLVLYYGSFAKAYWGEGLTPAEFEYVLSLEFGADRAVDLSGLAPHVDYLVSFLPRGKAALVSVPASGDLAVARAAAAALAAEFGDAEPATLAELRRDLSPPAPDLGRVRGILERARRQQSGWAFRLDPALPDRMKALVARACPGQDDCFSRPHQLRLLEADPDLFESWVHAVQRSRDEQTTITAYLDLVESQVDPVPDEYARRLAGRIRELEAIGFRVVRVPAYRVDLRSPRAWPGISYVNALVVDEQVFLPRFGLGAVEDELFRSVGTQLAPAYRVVAIDARRVLIRNGGLHCLAGLVR